MTKLGFSHEFEYQYTGYKSRLPIKPSLFIRLINPNNALCKEETFATIDSGSEVSVFNMAHTKGLAIATALGENEKLETIITGGGRMNVVYREVIIQLTDDAQILVRCFVGFSEQCTRNVIGRDGMFDKIRIAFQEKFQKFYIGNED